MGIPGILKEIGKGERIALSKLAIEHLERTNRPIRIAIDAAIWNFQNQASQGGKNPALRTLFFRLLKLLALPIHPVFVYDGKNKPLTKRGKTVSRYGTCIENETAKQLLSAFRFPHHTAPGEAEAECAFLQKKGVVDAVMSQDVDAIMFGSTLTLRDWSKEGTKGNKTPTHVSALDLNGIKRVSGLDPDGMILVALLSGGDYNESGIPGFGITLACEIARAGFGSDMLQLIRSNDQQELTEWRQRLEYELETNESGYFKKKHSKLKLPDDFPDRTILGYYTNPAVSNNEDLTKLTTKWSRQWSSDIDIQALRAYTSSSFDWNWKSGARRFIRCVAQPLFQDRLIRANITDTLFTGDDITDQRRHFTNDGIVELRLQAVPANIVEVDLDAEEDNPEYATEEPLEDPDSEEILETAESLGNDSSATSGPVKRKRSPWDPYAAERWWIPQTLLQLGVPAAVEAWQQHQRDIAVDPKKFATRKCSKTKPKPLDTNMKAGALHAFLGQNSGEVVAPPIQVATTINNAPKTPTKPHARPPVQQALPSIAEFFRPQKVTNEMNNDTRPHKQSPLKGCTNEVTTDTASDSPTKHLRTLISKTNIDAGAQALFPVQQWQERTGDSSADAPAMPTQKTSTDTSANAASSNFVTQRKSRRAKTARTEPLAEQGQTSHYDSTPAIPSLSVSSNHPSSSNLPAVKVNKSLYDLFQGTKSVSSQKSLVPRSKTAISRDSLPGTWKEIIVETVGHPLTTRTTYIDLTGE